MTFAVESPVAAPEDVRTRGVVYVNLGECVLLDSAARPLFLFNFPGNARVPAKPLTCARDKGHGPDGQNFFLFLFPKLFFSRIFPPLAKCRSERASYMVARKTTARHRTLHVIIVRIVSVTRYGFKQSVRIRGER